DRGEEPGLLSLCSLTAGAQFWVFTDTRADPGYPRPISNLGLPAGTVIGAAFVWSHNGKTYLFSGARYWRYDDQVGTVEPGYPKDATLWKGVPAGADDVTGWNDGNTYFFQGLRYWRFTGGSVEADVGYPRSAAQDWMYCQVPTTETPLGGCICSSGVPSLRAAPLIWIGAMGRALLW
uniref:Uncharacterized protein n=1 Tax=Sphenodon punctatus TaxID=8508 RepID=A0A8D0L7X8_SPHPU